MSRCKAPAARRERPFSFAILSRSEPSRLKPITLKGKSFRDRLSRKALPVRDGLSEAGSRAGLLSTYLVA